MNSLIVLYDNIWARYERIVVLDTITKGLAAHLDYNHHDVEAADDSITTFMTVRDAILIHVHSLL